MFNGDIPFSTPTQTSLLHLKLRPRGRQTVQHISWSQGCSTSPLISESILWTSTPVWTIPDSIIRLAKSAVASEQFCLLNPLLQFRLQSTSHFKVRMASSHHNSSTLVPLLGTPFNMILRFSDQMAYLPNAPRCSRQIHQRGRSSLRSSSSLIQSGQTVLPVHGPSIIPADNDPNWEDAPTTNPNTNLTANRPTSSTCLWSKLHWSNNTNEQLAEVLGRLANTLNANQTPRPNTNSRGTKAHIPNTFSSTEPNKLNNFLFQCRLYFHANLM